jgi:alpha-D-xyloside xylohydrolase
VPWAFDEEAVEVTRNFARLKNSLMPYLWAAAVQAHEEGLPVMRAMLLEFPADRTCAFLDRQYMLGPDLLVAPVFCDEGDVDIYVPAGEWTSYWDGSRVSGAGWARQRHGFGSLPLLVRPGAVVATGSRTDRPDYDDAVAPTFEVFGLADGDARTVRLFDASGAEQVRVEVERAGGPRTRHCRERPAPQGVDAALGDGPAGRAARAGGDRHIVRTGPAPPVTLAVGLNPYGLGCYSAAPGWRWRVAVAVASGCSAVRRAASKSIITSAMSFVSAA